jgi:DNA (cytosine-5)-methyltransferase 1
VDNTEQLNHLSLCSGYEGIGLGLRRVFPNLREIAHVEIEAFAISNLVAKMEAGELDPAPIFTDVKTFPYGKFRGKVDILTGGFPCQPFSQAGLRKSTEDPRHLFPYIERGIKDCQPTIVFLENVEGILSSTTGDGQPVLQYVLGSLEGLGYRATAGIFSASEVGAPHRRKRVFIMGYATNNGCATSEITGETSRSQEEGRLQESQGGSNELANGSGERLEGNCWHFHEETECSRETSGDERRTSIGGLSGASYPARPSEPQHDWEEPRVIESKLGRTVNGNSSRMDRLRLLGNGVVPATATKAFLTLIQRLV